MILLRKAGVENIRQFIKDTIWHCKHDYSDAASAKLGELLLDVWNQLDIDGVLPMCEENNG